jgi:glycosyltransferase involved in cell wall biosynthesis
MAEARDHAEIWIAINSAWNVFNFRKELIRALKTAGYRVVAYAPRDDYVSRLDELGIGYVPMELKNAGVNPMGELQTIWRMSRQLRDCRPDLVLTFTPKVNMYLSIAGRLQRVPVIANVSGLGRTFIVGGWLTIVAKVLYRVAFGWPRKIFFQNPEDRDAFLSGRLVSEDRVELLPGSGVDLSRFAPVVGAARGPGFVFLMAARLMWDKGVAEYVAAARELRREFPEARFLLAGFLDVPSPSAVAEADVKAWEAEGVIEFLGRRDDMPEIFAQADCVVLPSYREGMPRTLLEAAAMAIPVCASDVPGCRHAVVDGVTGFLCAPRNATSLAQAMRKMLLLPADQRRSMGESARQRVEREFDERTVVSRYLGAVNQAIGRASRGMAEE